MPEEGKETQINLPQTGFPMKGDMARREPDFAKAWEKDELYKKLLEKSKDRPFYILHDGPPYANGNIHMGHVLNKVVKDIVVRSRFFMGFNSPYIPGWDCHGMPIENKVAETLGPKRSQMSKLEIRKHCHEYAMKYVGLQKEQFKRLGVMGDWEHPYLTLSKDYEDAMAEIFWEMYKKGLVYKGLKPVYWCYKDETALAEAEVEYKDHKTPSVYVRFKISDASKSKAKIEDAYIIIWTTTPWTLPANVAIAVHPDFEYALVGSGSDKYILAAALIPEFSAKTGKEYKIIKKFKGTELEHTITGHPFINRKSQVILADYVTLDTGTGCVHIAPGHGYEDYIYGLKYNLPILNPVDSKGRFSEEFQEMMGVNVFDANPKIIELLKSKNALLHSEEVTHSYPHCWRCKHPIIFRATTQWFISMDRNNFRQQALGEVKKVKWLNEWGETRITKMIETRPDWCISRQRAWGVPIFAFHCKSCGEIIVTEESMKKTRELIKKEGSDAWFRYSADEILGKDFKCPHCHKQEIEKENDIFDVWFDSGSSSFAALYGKHGLNWPADIYLEGSDQYRGWFQSSLLTAVGFKGLSPFKSVISHGWVVDAQGRAMHKSLGNVIDPLDLIKKSGADLLRLWSASEDFTKDQSASDEIMARITDSYRRVRNTFRYMLGNLFDFEPGNEVPYEKLLPLDRYALDRLQRLCDDMEKSYENFEFYKVYRDFNQFCSVFLSSFYFDILKDRLYTFKKDSIARRSGQTVLYKMMVKLTKRIAPILVFTADEAWQFMPEKLKKEKYVQLELWADDKKDRLLEDAEIKLWDTLMSLRAAVLKKIEEKREAKIIKHPYEAAVKLKYKSKALDETVKKFSADMAEIFIVSQAACEPYDLADAQWDSGLEITVDKAAGEKCERCWRYQESVGKTAEHPNLCSRCAEQL